MKKPIDVSFTKEGFAKIKQELQNLIDKRPQVLARLVAAREQGDLSENAGYHASKEELGTIDRRIRELKLLIRFGQVVVVKSSDSISIGSIVTVKSPAADFEYEIVGKLEADPTHGKLSEVSPIGAALLGKKVGDKVQVETPNGKIDLQVLNIRY